MKIKPNATSDEINSPFYKANEDFCRDFENYISNKNGKVKGNYNAWSYLVFGKIDSPRSWSLMYKKSTLTSSGNLLFSSEYQSLLVKAEWKTKIKGRQDPPFLIRKKTGMDFFKKLVNKSLSRLDLSEEYILETKNSGAQLISIVSKTLKTLFLSQEIYKIDYRNSVLKIEMRTDKPHFKILDNLINRL